MIARTGRLAILALLVTGVAGCLLPGAPREPAPIPTETEARALLNAAVAAAQRGDFGALCALGDANCPFILDESGRDRVPPRPPIVAGTWVLPAEGQSDGGLVLQVCGRDADDRPYATEILVFNAERRLLAISPVYWSGMRVPTSSTVGGNDPLEFEGCP